METRAIPTKIADITPEAEQKLIAFCEEQISKMSRYAKLNNTEGLIGFYELNRALSEYQNINLSLISIGLMAKVELTKAKEDFEDWYAGKYIQVREELNPRSISQSKWYAAKEIEMEVRIRFKDEYKQKLLNLEYAEHKVALIRRLQDSWAAHQFILARLSRNIETELHGSFVENNGPKE